MDVQIESLERLTKNSISLHAPVLSGNISAYSDDYSLDVTSRKDIITYPGLSNFVTQLTNFKQSILPINEANNYKLLKKSFEKEQPKIKISINKINNIFQEMALLLAELPFEKSSVEITSSESLRFSMAFADNILLIISKPFETIEDMSEDEVVFSLFKERKMITSNVSKTKEVVEGFKNFLSL